MDESVYNIETETLLLIYAKKDLITLSVKEKEDVYEKAASDLVKYVREGKIWFPFQKFFRGNPHELFENLKTIDLPITRGAYRLRSYYPQYGSYMPPKFRGEQIVIAGTRDTYEVADVLSDHFIEHIRLKAKRYDQVRSILECWTIDSCLKEIMKVVLNKKVINPKTLRDAIYESTPETKIFNPTWARSLLKLVIGDNLAGKHWLDISAGWGDRLLAAISLNMNYTGFDPNIELKEGHSQMIELFGDAKRHRVIYEPFEKATIPGGPYDVIMTSPPYFTIEEYAPNQEGQSIISYPNFDQWMVWFLFASLSKAWENLKDNGYLILHLGDAKTIRTSEATNIFIENYLQNASWEGVIGLQGEAGFPRPVWVWKKIPKGQTRILWEPQDSKAYPPGQKISLSHLDRTLFNSYPELQMELIKYYANKYAPNYLVRKTNATSIRDHISKAFPDIPREKINKILDDDLMISSLLETLGIEGTIKWATAMTQLALRH